VASHAQKYFIRQLSGGKDKRRASIHDITTVNLDNEALSSDNSNNSTSKASSSPEQSSTITVQTQHQHSSSTMPGKNFQWDQQNNNGGPTIAFDDLVLGNVFVSPDGVGFGVGVGVGVGSFGFSMQGQNMQRNDLLQNYIESEGLGFPDSTNPDLSSWMTLRFFFFFFSFFLFLGFLGTGVWSQSLVACAVCNLCFVCFPLYPFVLFPK